MVNTTWRGLVFAVLALGLCACASNRMDLTDYDWEQDPKGLLSEYRVYRAQTSDEAPPHWVLSAGQPEQAGLLPVSLDPRLSDSYPGILLQENTSLFQPSASFAGAGITLLLTQLQPEIAAQLRKMLAKAPELNDQLPWDNQHKPDVFWGKPEQFRFVRGAFGNFIGYLHCSLPATVICYDRALFRAEPSPWQLDGYQHSQNSGQSRYLLVMDWSPRTHLPSKEPRVYSDLRTRRVLGALSRELGVSHWLMLQLSMADFDQWLLADANGDYQHDFVLQALLLDTAGRVQQAKISPFTLRWNSASLLLSEAELSALQPSWQPALEQVLHAFGLQPQEQQPLSQAHHDEGPASPAASLSD